MMNVISGNDAVPVAVKNNGSENAENISAQESFMDTMQQLCSQSEVSADEMPAKSDKPSEKTDSSADSDKGNYQNVFENMFFVYSPVTYADLSELSTNTESQKSVEAVSAELSADTESQKSLEVVLSDEIQQYIPDTEESQSSDNMIETVDSDKTEVRPQDNVVVGQIENDAAGLPSETIAENDNQSDTEEIQPSDSVIVGQNELSAKTMVRNDNQFSAAEIQPSDVTAVVQDKSVQQNIQSDSQTYAADNDIVGQNAVRNNDVKVSDNDSQQIENLNNENVAAIPEKPVSNSNADKNFSGGNSNDSNENNPQENPFIKENTMKSDFYKSINQVKEFMKDNAEKFSQPSETDISQLEKNVQQFSIPQFQMFSVNQETVTQQNDIYSPAEILSQTSESIISNVNNGSDEFTVVLNPEGLGKITVTILKGDVSNVLSLTVSNPKTAEILSSDINSLNQALRNLDIEFAAIHIENSQESAQYQGYQQQYEREDAENSNNKHRSHRDDLSDDEDDFILENEQLEAI